MASLVCPLVVSGLWLCVHVSVVLIVLHEDVLLPQHPQHGHTGAVVTQLVKLKQTTTDYLDNKFALLWGEAQLCLPYVC